MLTQRNRRGLFNSTFGRKNISGSTRNYNAWFRKTVIRTIISIILLVIIITIQISNFEQSKRMLDFIKIKLESEFDIKACLAEAKKLPGYISTFGEKVVTVMKMEHKPAKKFIPPIDGKVITRFNEQIEGTSSVSRGLIYTGDEGLDIYSVGNGVVINVGSNKLVGNYIIVKHKGELLSVYKLMGTNDVSVNQKVEQGQVIGTSSGKLLLEIWYRNEPVDPIIYMDMKT